MVAETATQTSQNRTQETQRNPSLDNGIALGTDPNTMTVNQLENRDQPPQTSPETTAVNNDAENMPLHAARGWIEGRYQQGTAELTGGGILTALGITGLARRWGIGGTTSIGIHDMLSGMSHRNEVQALHTASIQGSSNEEINQRALRSEIFAWGAPIPMIAQLAIASETVFSGVFGIAINAIVGAIRAIQIRNVRRQLEAHAEYRSGPEGAKVAAYDWLAKESNRTLPRKIANVEQIAEWVKVGLYGVTTVASLLGGHFFIAGLGALSVWYSLWKARRVIPGMKERYQSLEENSKFIVNAPARAAVRTPETAEQPETATENATTGEQEPAENPTSRQTEPAVEETPRTRRSSAPPIAVGTDPTTMTSAQLQSRTRPERDPNSQMREPTPDPDRTPPFSGLEASSISIDISSIEVSIGSADKIVDLTTDSIRKHTDCSNSEVIQLLITTVFNSCDGISNRVNRTVESLNELRRFNRISEQQYQTLTRRLADVLAKSKYQAYLLEESGLHQAKMVVAQMEQQPDLIEKRYSAAVQAREAFHKIRGQTARKPEYATVMDMLEDNLRFYAYRRANDRIAVTA